MAVLLAHPVRWAGLIAGLRKVARARGRLPVRARLASSPKVTLLTKCWASMAHWPRTQPVGTAVSAMVDGAG
ncbi:hypothetical protein AB0J25_22315 [Streptomyces sp. NPDC049910]|uniref:hypothetical protein n=1 Tax=Streptomyces sp. NPDC049910 TaxID=3155278 RepID=UPI00342553EA